MSFTIHHGDALAVLRDMADESVHCCVTSPPYYGLRDYGVDGQIGLEHTPEEYIAKLVAVFCEVRRVLRADATCWINIGDSYAGGGKGGGGSYMAERKDATWQGQSQANGRQSAPAGVKPKDLLGIPWTLAFALRADEWYLRQDLIWSKPNPMPESVRDRCTKAHEYVFLLSKSARYWYDADAIAEDAVYAGLRKDEKRGAFAGKTEAMPGRNSFRAIRDVRNKRSVWTLATQPTPEAHFATFPLELPETCILAGCPHEGTVLDPFAGAGTTGLAALKHGRGFVGVELNKEYINIAYGRAQKFMPLLIA